MSITERVERYNSGQLEAAEVIELFQELISSGMIIIFNKHYQEVAKNFIRDGLCKG